MDLDELRKVLASLRVKSGLVGVRKDLIEPWSIGFWYNRDRKSFVLVLEFKRTLHTMVLDKKDVETRGKSMWMADNTWRLSEIGLEKAVKGVWSAFQQEARNRE